MLKIEVDVFSGRPNPTWLITDEAISAKILDRVSERPDAVARPGTGFDGLGIRELRVSTIQDDAGKRRGIPQEFAVASTAAKDFRESGRIALELLELMPVDPQIRLREHELTPLDRGMRDLLIKTLKEYLDKPPRLKLPKLPLLRNPLISTTHDDRCERCDYEVSKFNPGFWNRPAVQPHNNCYNYARNWRTDTFAQPGRAHGQQASTMACGAVTAAAMADGLKHRCDCLPKSEFPRRLMALVIWPGVDYHWYRHQRGGFWGHKPGQTAARNVDNSNNLISNPETCNRGGYTDFCGYFYAGRSVVIN
ncbi:MAG: hypothetical protein U1E46_18340 [Hyphomicrobiales bacterium]